MLEVSFNSVAWASIIALFISTIIYVLWSRWGFYKKGNYVSLVTEIKFVKWVLVVSFFIIVSTTVLQIAYKNISNETLDTQFNQCVEQVAALGLFCGAIGIGSIDLHSYIFTVISGLAPIIFYTGLIKIISLIVRKDFRFYLSWGYLGIALKKTREVEKSNCLRLSLKTYDSYLRKRLDVGVKDISLILPNNFLINKRLSNDTIESFRTS